MVFIMANTKLYENYKELKKLEAIETVIDIIMDRIEDGKHDSEHSARETVNYLEDVYNNIEKTIWLETEYQK
jgi:hypothetical protein